MGRQQQSKRKVGKYRIPTRKAARRLEQLDRAIAHAEVVELDAERGRRELVADLAELGELRRQLERVAPFAPASWWPAGWPT